MKNLFEISKIIFEDPKEYSELSKLDKIKNFFMLNRRFAIQYPMQAQVLNHLNINQPEAIDIWQRFISSKYNKQPHWLFTKGIKATKKEKESKMKISHNTIVKYAQQYNLDTKQVYDALNFFGKDFLSELKTYEKLIN